MAIPIMLASLGTESSKESYGPRRDQFSVIYNSLTTYFVGIHVMN
jgi:hypothetical protein